MSLASGTCARRAAEFRKFLDLIAAAIAHDLDVHSVVDNYASHKSPQVRKWLAKKTALVRPTDTDKVVLAKSEQTLFACSMMKKNQAWHRSKRQRSMRRHRTLHQPQQCRSKALKWPKSW